LRARRVYRNRWCGAGIVLMSPEGMSNQFIAERCGVNVPTIKRFGGAAAPKGKICLTTRLNSGFAGI
jgi:hypothetical protein